MANYSAKIDEYWQNKSAAFSNHYGAIFGIPLTPVGYFLNSRYKKITRFLERLSGEVVIDVGCGSGAFMKPCIEQGRFVIGIDYSWQMIDIAKKNLTNFPKDSYKLIIGDATKMPIKDRSIDILLASGLVEYLTRDQIIAFFQEVERVVKKGGSVIITFPKKDSPFAFLRQGLGLEFRKKILHLPPVESILSKKEIAKLFKEIGLKPFLWDEVMLTMYIVVAKKI